MVLHKHVYGEESIFVPISVPLVNNPMGKFLGMIRRGTYQSLYEDSGWEHEPVSDLWPDIEPDSEYSSDVSSYEVIKYQDNPDYQ